MSKRADYALARQAIMMAYTLLAPDDLTVTDLNQHLASIQQTERERAAGKEEFTEAIEAARESGAKEIETFELRLQRSLFFEVFNALDRGLDNKWFRRGS